MKQIITIQHTQSIHHTNGMVGSWTDWDLSELGIEQAERIGQKLAKQLSGHKIVMYASDLLRAKHTAEIVAKHMGITPNIRTELRERNLGKCVGKSVQWLRENIEVQEKTIDDRKECTDKEVFTLRANSVMCYGISRCLPCCDLLGQRNFPHKVIVNVDLLCAVSAGFIRRINDDFFNQFVKHIWRQFTRLGVFSNTLQETLDVQGLLLTGIYHAL